MSRSPAATHATDRTAHRVPRPSEPSHRRNPPAVRATGLVDVTPHDLRASHATWVAQRHGVMAAAARLGHAHASVTTRHYARTFEGQDRTVADDFDEQDPQ